MGSWRAFVRKRGRSIRHGRNVPDRKVRVVGQVNDIRVYSYTGTLGNELTGIFPAKAPRARAGAPARSFV